MPKKSLKELTPFPEVTASSKIINDVLALTARNYGLGKISDELNIPFSDILTIRSSKEFQQRLIQYQSIHDEPEPTEVLVQDSREMLLRASKKVARRLVEIAFCGSSEDRVQLDACCRILEMAGIKPKDIIEAQSRNYTPDEITSALKTLQEVENVTLRLTNSDSGFVISRTRITRHDSPSTSSDTEIGSDVQPRIKEATE